MIVPALAAAPQRPVVGFSRTQLSRFAELLRTRLGHGRLATRPELLARKLEQAMIRTDAPSVDTLLDALGAASEDGPVLRELAEAVTNHETSFFRDGPQLRAIVEELAAPRAELALFDGPVRILSAGCATGEEVYSLAMWGLESLHLTWGRRIEVVGVDVSADSIVAARTGRYRVESLLRAGEGPEAWAQRFLRHDTGGLVVRELIRSQTRFELANLVSPSSLEPLGTFDVVVCRNVLIYFDEESTRRAVESLWERLRPGGALVFAAAELAWVAPLLPEIRRRGALAWFERPREEGR